MHGAGNCLSKLKKYQWGEYFLSTFYWDRQRIAFGETDKRIEAPLRLRIPAPPNFFEIRGRG
jgi:hypothetical protein